MLHHDHNTTDPKSIPQGDVQKMFDTLASISGPGPHKIYNKDDVTITLT